MAKLNRTPNNALQLTAQRLRVFASAELYRYAEGLNI